MQKGLITSSQETHRLYDSSLHGLVTVVDAGNTDVVFCVFRDEEPLRSWRVPAKLLRTRNDVWKRFEKEFRARELDPEDVGGSVICSVNPVMTKLCSSALRQHLRHLPLVVHDGVDTGIVISYDNPRRLGADRLCTAAAAYHLMGGPVIAVDCGTATTFDAVTSEGEYIGGAIAPGIRTSAEALHSSTAQLPKFELKFPSGPIGSDTVPGMQSGVLFGAVDAINGMLERMKGILGPGTKTVLTGGFAELLKHHLSGIDDVRPLLVLEGALRIYHNAWDRKSGHS